MTRAWQTLLAQWQSVAQAVTKFYTVRSKARRTTLLGIPKTFSMPRRRDGMPLTCFLANLNGSLLAHLWPAERVVVGLRVCSWVRESLLRNADQVLLSGNRMTSPVAAICENLCGDLLKFHSHSLKVELQARFCELMVESIFSSMSQLKPRGWAGELTCLDFGSCGINSDGAHTLAGIISQHHSLKHVILDRNCIGDPGVALLTSQLRRSSKLKQLDLGHNCLRSDGARRLGEMCKYCTELEHLSVCWNRIGDEGISHIAQAIQWTNLKFLDVCKNNIGEEGAKQLFEAMEDCSTLTHLNLSRNFLGDMGFTHLALSLTRKHSLKTLELSSNYVGPNGASSLAHSLSSCAALTHLDLASNNFGDPGIERLAAELHSASSLTGLSLSNCHVGNLGASRLVERLPSCSLRWIDLGGNRLGQDLVDQMRGLNVSVILEAKGRCEVMHE